MYVKTRDDLYQDELLGFWDIILFHKMMWNVMKAFDKKKDILFVSRWSDAKGQRVDAKWSHPGI